MTVWENVRMGAYTVRDRALVERRLAAVCESFPIVRERRHEPPRRCRAGSKDRGVRAGADAQSRLVVLDEPSMGLDPKTRHHRLRHHPRHESGGTNHPAGRAERAIGLGLATHGVVMESGRVRLQGWPAVLDNPEIGRLYLGATA